MHSILELIKMAAEGRPYTPPSNDMRIEIPKQSEKEESKNDSQRINRITQTAKPRWSCLP